MKIFAILSLLFAFSAQAQTNAWGTGQWGGNQACPYQNNPMAMGAPGASNMSDEVRELMDNLKETKSKLAAKKSQKVKLERDLDRSRKDIEDALQSNVADFIFAHMENSRNCDEYFPPENAPAARSSRPKTTPSTGPFEKQEWAELCSGHGGISPRVCTDYRGDEKRASSSNCQKALPAYRKNFAASQKLQDEIDGLDRTIETMNDNLKDARKEASLPKDGGGYCLECMQRNSGYQMQAQQPSTNWGGVLANVGMGLAGMYAGYESNKTTAQYNSNIGFATQPTSSFGYGYPYFQAAAYGAMGGGIGQGSFGCGAGYGGTGNMNGMMGMGGPFGNNSMYGNMYGNNGGAFGGYPQNMMGSQMGGGMYNPGMGSWGMAGPWGNNNNMSGLISGGGLNGINGMNGMNPYGQQMGSPYGNMMNPMMGLGGQIGGGLNFGAGIGMGGGYGGALGGNPQMQQYQMYLQQQQQQQQYSNLAYQQQMASMMARMQGSGMYGGAGYGTGYGTGYGSTGISSASGSISGGALGSSNLLGSSMQNNYYYPNSLGTTATTPLGTGR